MEKTVHNVFSVQSRRFVEVHAIIAASKPVEHIMILTKSSYRNKIVFLEANHISNLDVPPFRLLKPEADSTH